ncbi:hypothetical protein AMIS_18750 [Actinoplanes missouriensis 431]|uniref:Uncharacterized protein n=1 Tax=Actinoplanes missouriensis (strain ATCC 14538 / DSM 43046 / CBS 188.64 / JCM 3121 / NBRC 102363 / NCIMB 12654 / NRRL B-3342 / UNCC 431) TaxID=512565 RepID=I0H258_ACTM4|nr:hypothetical protein [Actinoplanes missouriensis]BAL87095.1 hypothetical protein AMIS_18750 [Actinoplanes missouriensis 431]
MQEADVREALKTYVTEDEPAMGLTAGTVLNAGRRSRRNRRLAGVAGAALVAALAGAGVAVVSGGGSTDPEFAAAGACLGRPGARPSGAIAADRPLSPELVEWAATSLTCHLGEALPRLLPDARYAPVPGVPVGPLVGFSHGGEPPWGNRVDALALIRDREGTGDLTVTVGVADPSAAATAEDECRRETVSRCTVRSGPHGETVLVGTEADGTPADAPRDIVVRVYRGWSEIYVQASNTDRQAVDGGAPVATRPEPVLSEDQAVGLALSPELYLF